jgi:hypothetical protein
VTCDAVLLGDPIELRPLSHANLWSSELFMEPAPSMKGATFRGIRGRGQVTLENDALPATAG